MHKEEGADLEQQLVDSTQEGSAGEKFLRGFYQPRIMHGLDWVEETHL